jgi:hypothetical protein
LDINPEHLQLIVFAHWILVINRQRDIKDALGGEFCSCLFKHLGATRFRAIGDCGRTDRYIWDGSKFRLSEQLVMPECRGSFDRIRVWKVDVVDR